MSKKNLPGLIPYPDLVRLLTTPPARVTSEWAITGPTGPAGRVAGFLSQALGCEVGVFLSKRGGRPACGEILLRIEEPGEGASPEAYRLRVWQSGIEVTGASFQGLTHGIATLAQLIGTSSIRRTVLEIPALEIEDQPDFAWRGMMLDCSRHFFPADRIMGFIDVLARYKFNTFHWHLTDDQGWRVEIKSRPRLTEIGAWRSGSAVPSQQKTVDSNSEAFSQQEQLEDDGEPHGGFYTQEQIRDVVAFAADRGITVMPEIDLPGHLSAAVASYPEIGVTDVPGFSPRVMTRWGVFEYVLAPTPQAFSFMEDVLGEVIDLFPSRWIHIGGDEAYLGRQVWERSPLCQDFMKLHHLKDSAALERHFLLHAREILHSCGRRLTGWDEIAEAGVPSDSLVMAWRQGGRFALGAAQAGHEIVLAPTSHLYFDRAQGADEPTAFAAPFIDLEKVYSFNPVPEDFPRDLHHLIQGAQGQLWTEYMPNWERVETMAFPRALALAEVMWSGSDPGRWPDFRSRMRDQFQTLEALGMNASRREF